jgi:hypothetical protein
MAIVGPHIDEVTAGDDLASLESFAARLPRIG